MLEEPYYLHMIAGRHSLKKAISKLKFEYDKLQLDKVDQVFQAERKTCRAKGIGNRKLAK